MKQIKKVPFDYEYFKANPETKLETRDGQKTFLIGEKKIEGKYPLIFESVRFSCFPTTKNGKYDTSDNNSFLDVFMLLESKEEVRYTNVYADYAAGDLSNTLEDAIKGHGYGAKSVAKLTIVDGEIDFKNCETVHKY